MSTSSTQSALQRRDVPQLRRQSPLPDPIDSVPVLRLPSARSKHQCFAVEVQIHDGIQFNFAKEGTGIDLKLESPMNNAS